jgi:hypothetical protein
VPHPPLSLVHTGLAQRLLATRLACSNCGTPLASAPAPRACGACRRTHYCARACMRAHAAAHGSECFAVLKARLLNRDAHFQDAATERALRAREAALLQQGPPASAATASELAAVRAAQGSFLLQVGRAAEAEAVLRANLKARTSALGLQHRDTLASLNALAGALSAQGRLLPALASDECTGLYREMLEARRSALGPRHAATLACANGYAVLLSTVPARAQEAVALHRETLSARREVLGAAHPSTLASASTLGLLLLQLSTAPAAAAAAAEPRQGSAGKERAEAGALLREAAGGLMEALGPGHPSTLAAQCNLVQWLCAGGGGRGSASGSSGGGGGGGERGAAAELAEAQQVARAALAEARSLLGARHESTLRIMGALAGALAAAAARAQGLQAGQFWEERKRLLVEVAAARREALGVNHPAAREAARLASEAAGLPPSPPPEQLE